MSQHISIDTVYVTQTQVLELSLPNYRLVGEKDTLSKVPVLSADGSYASPFEVRLGLANESSTLTLEGLITLPTSFCKEPGKT